MAYVIEKVDVWSGVIDDVPGGLAAKLGPLAEAGVALTFMLARRSAPGKGVVFLAPIKGAAATKAAQAAGLAPASDLSALCVSGPDKAGLGACIAAALAAAGVNMRGISAMAVGRKAILCIAFDDKPTAAKAQRILAKALNK